MEQIKKYIRGNSKRGQEVIAELEKLGGVNQFKLKGNEEDTIYIIVTRKYNPVYSIDFENEKSLTGQLILTHPEWEEIKLPEQFKDGDIVYVKSNEQNEYIIIFKGIKNDHIHKYACFAYQCLSIDKCALCHLVDAKIIRLATEEEKEKLFQAIKENGYKWNAEEKELKKLIEPKFKVGDRVKFKGKNIIVEIVGVERDDEYYNYLTYDNYRGCIYFASQDLWELVHNKFDISTLVPFESRVLVRDEESELWYPAIWGLKTDDIDYPYILVGGISYCQCIPYEGNEHLLGTKNDCDEYDKTWE